MNKKLPSIFVLLALFTYNIASCGKPFVDTPDTPPQPDLEEFPDMSLYNNTLFTLKDVPVKETASDILFRENRLSNRLTAFYASLDNAISSGGVEAWLKTYYSQYSSEKDAAEPYTVLITQVMREQKYYEALKPYILPILKNNISVNIALFQQEVQNDLAVGRSGLIFDLNTVHPVRYILESAYDLRLLGEYDATTEKTVTDFIEANIENKVNYYTGQYRTSGYNKEIFAMDIAFWVKMLYGNRYPCTNNNWEAIWTNVTVSSYDADNSPHYDSGTGFYLILRWGLLLNRIDDMRTSPHIRRIIDRMAKTVMTSGMSAKFAKSMENYYSNYTELAIDGGRTLAWCLKVGYLLYENSNYLYIARKYEDLRFNSLNVNRWKGIVCDLWPDGINFDRQTARPTDDFGLVHKTQRITSANIHNGTMLGRGVTDYLTVQDKIFLSTGTHPDAPSVLIDLSFSQSKAAYDHRIGINVSMYRGAQVNTYYGRPGEPFRINRPYVAPTSLEGFPVFNVAQGDVVPIAAYTDMLGYNYQTDYVLSDYSVKTLEDGSAYCNIAYSKFEYTGVSAIRKVVLLHNGVMVILDRLKNAGPMQLNAATIYSLWPGVESMGENWVLQTAHTPTTVTKPSVGEIPVLFCFPSTSTKSSVRVEDDPMRNSGERSRVKTLICQSNDVLSGGKEFDFVTVIAPVKHKESVESFVKQLVCEKIEGGYLLYLPSSEDKAYKIVLR